MLMSLADMLRHCTHSFDIRYAFGDDSLPRPKDVANMITTATLSGDGTHYIVNGTKKWITGGM